MTKTSRTVLFFGNERLATAVSTNCQVFRTLIKDGYAISALIISQFDYSSRQKQEPEIIDIATKAGVPIVKITAKEDLVKAVEEHPADIGVLVAFGQIIPSKVIDMLPKGIINLHPSLLPKGRGPTPIEDVILKGYSQTAASIMQLTPAMDQGPVYAQETLSLGGDESKQWLADTLNKMGANLMSQTLPDILGSQITPFEQDSNAASYTHLINKLDGQIDWTKPAYQIEREIRAYLNWPSSRTTIKGIEAIIMAAKVVRMPQLKPGELSNDKSHLFVGTGADTLEIERLKPLSKSTMSASGFIAGYFRD